MTLGPMERMQIYRIAEILNMDASTVAHRADRLLRWVEGHSNSVVALAALGIVTKSPGKASVAEKLAKAGEFATYGLKKPEGQPRASKKKARCKTTK